MFSVASSAKYAMKSSVAVRSFATVKKSKPLYRKLVNMKTITIGAIGGVAWYAYKHPYDKESYLLSLDNPSAYEIETLTPKQVALHTMLLNRTGSRLMGKFAQLTIPVSWRKPLYSYVSKLIGIDVDEFKGSFEDYPTPNSFFTRDLKPNARPIIRSEKVMLSPVDGTVSIMEEHIAPTSGEDIKLHQVKGISYSLKEFIADNLHMQHDDNNLYSTVIYLAPSNYHHIHNPVDFSITDRVHVPGAMLPVKQSYVRKVKGLFTLNERVILSGSWQEGFFSLGMVGAYNVGSIRITNPEDPVTTNRPHELIYSKHRHHRRYSQPWEAMTGDRLGTFELGSTVVLAFEAPAFHWLVEPGTKVRMGQPIGYVGERTEEVDAVIEAYETQTLASIQVMKGKEEEKEEEVVIEEVFEEEEEEGKEEEEMVVEETTVDVIEEVFEKEKEKEEEEVNEIEEESAMVCEVADVISELSALAAMNEEMAEEEKVEIVEEKEMIVMPSTNETTDVKEVKEALEEMEWNLSRGNREEHYW